MLITGLREEPEDTLCQFKLNRVVDSFAKVAAVTTLLLFFMDIVKFLVSLRNSLLNAEEKGQLFLRNLLVVLAMALLAIPGGLALAVPQALVFVISRLAKSNITVRKSNMCEAMGRVTTVCTEKTGYLTQNCMDVVVGALGVSNTFYNEKQRPTTLTALDQATTMKSFFAKASAETVTLLRSCIVSSSTAFEEISDNGESRFVGSEIESALLRFVRDYLDMEDVETSPSTADVVHLEPFNSEKKYTACVLRIKDEKRQFYRLYVKGASELLLQQTTRVVDSALGTYALSATDRQTIGQTIRTYASDSLATLMFNFRDFPAWPPSGCEAEGYDKSHVEIANLLNNMTLIGVVGIRDPLRPGIENNISSCVSAGVSVKLVTGGDLLAAEKIASDCGILGTGGIVMTGPKFMKLSSSQRKQILPRLQVLARSTPDSKRAFIEALGRNGERVAVTIDNGNDICALRYGMIGLSNAHSSELAKEASAMTLNDGGFVSIYTAIILGRCVTNSVRKILQVHLLKIYMADKSFK